MAQKCRFSQAFSAPHATLEEVQLAPAQGHIAVRAVGRPAVVPCATAIQHIFPSLGHSVIGFLLQSRAWQLKWFGKSRCVSIAVPCYMSCHVGVV